MRCYQILIKGNVQGVGYRITTQRKAHELNITGWVKNEPNGSVVIFAEGAEPAVQHLIDWCYTGSPLSKVEEVDAIETSVQGFCTFEIRK